MLISIIIPVYNLEKHITQCLISILKQNINSNNFEIIIINDNSKDRSLKKIKSFKKKFNNFTILNNKNNLGPGLTRNKGISVAKGKYIMFIDGDDFLPKNSLENIQNFLTKKNYDFLGYNFNKILPKKKILKNYRKDFSFITKNFNSRIKNFLNGEIDGSVIFSVIKKSLILKKKIYFYPGLHEDILFIFKIYFYSKKFDFIYKPLYLKKNRKGSIVNILSKQRIYDLFKQSDYIKKFLIKKKINFKKINKFYIRGLVGNIGGILAETLEIKSFTKRKDIYIYVYKIMSKMLKNERIPHHSKKDKIVNLFLNTPKTEKKNKDLFKIYEKEVIKLIKL
jgi:poly(ribitol-phosphate) beta-N-acetylglucosaminyltransferase